MNMEYPQVYVGVLSAYFGAESIIIQVCGNRKYQSTSDPWLQDVPEHDDADCDQLRGVHLPGGQHHCHGHCPGQHCEHCLDISEIEYSARPIIRTL